VAVCPRFINTTARFSVRILNAPFSAMINEIFLNNRWFETIKLMTASTQECGCKIVRKYDGVSQREFKKAVS